MRLLLDTHVLLWWTGDNSLSAEARAAVAAPTSMVSVSSASLWEAEIKAAAGKLDLRADLVEEARVNGFAELPISFAHARAAAGLPRHHGDPFDRILIAQAQLEGMTIVTRDRRFVAYDVRVLAA